MALLALLLVLFPPLIYKTHLLRCRVHDPYPPLHTYYQPGDFIIGSIVPPGGFISSPTIFTEEPPRELYEDLVLIPKNYQHIVALAFAVNEINENPQLLPNFTLGFRIYGSYANAKKTYHGTMLLISGLNRLITNYICGPQNNLAAVIGGLDAHVSLHMANILKIYKIPQLIYGVAPVMNDKSQGLPFYQLVPQEALQHKSIISLLLHFKWTWIAVLIMDDENGERLVQTVFPEFSQRGICFAFIGRIPRYSFDDTFKYMVEEGAKICDQVMGSKSNVIVIYGDSGTMVFLRWIPYLLVLNDVINKPEGKVFIMTAEIELVSFWYQRDWNAELFLHGALAFTIHSNNPPKFKTFAESRNPYSTKRDGFIKDFWQQAFDCVIPNAVLNKMENGDICTGDEKLESLPASLFEMSMTGHSYSIYNAVYTVAHALNSLFSSALKQRAKVDREGIKLQNKLLWQELHHFLKSVSFNNSVGDKVSLNDHGELIAGFDVINWIASSNQSFNRMKVGQVDPQTHPGEAFTINEDAITWPHGFTQVPPLSVCSKSCHPGSSKKIKEGEPFCCYDCIPCPEGKISNQEDMDDCKECSVNDYPSKNQSLCIPKIVNFLTFEEPFGISLASYALTLSLITILVLAAFAKHHDTPIVKANNRNLTYMLLISILLCFLSALLFIGRPETVTCFLQQTVFGIIFSVAISCILAKTITVVLAFMAIKPGSRMRKWVGKELPSFIVLSCSLFQTGICTVWLGMYPPFPDMDMHSIAEEIVLECNQGSIIMFYCVFGYMGFLASVSFIMAFFARKLPDSFNEAKFITFSMLVFCSVWIPFVPSYLSMKGKYTVALEIFCILFSSTGILGCIFAPKCYILLFRPELNSREQFLRKKVKDLSDDVLCYNITVSVIPKDKINK